MEEHILGQLEEALRKYRTERHSDVYALERQDGKLVGSTSTIELGLHNGHATGISDEHHDTVKWDQY